MARFYPRKKITRRRKVLLKSKRRYKKGSKLTRLIKNVVVNRLTVKNSQPFDGQALLQLSTNSSGTTCPAWTYSGAQLAKLFTNIDSTLTAAKSANRLYVNNVNYHVNLTNQDLGNANVVAYYVSCRRDCPVTTNISSINSLITSGWAQSGLTTTDPGITIFESPQFVKAFKVYKVKKFTLAPGETITLKTSQKSNRRVDASDIFEDTATLVPTKWAFAKRSLGIVFKVMGQATNDATTKTNVGLSNPKIDFTYLIKYDYTWLDDRTPTNYATVTDPSGAALAAVTTADVISDAAIVTDGTKA